VLHGGGGNDTLDGDAGRDHLYGEAGDGFLMDVDNAYFDPVDALDGGPNATGQGDNDRALPTGILLNCERAN
jgi:Ca2+-binding RTX toxin-like protein